MRIVKQKWKSKSGTLDLSLKTIIELCVSVILIIAAIYVFVSFYNIFFYRVDAATMNNFKRLCDQVDALVADPNEYSYAIVPYYLGNYLVAGYNIKSDVIDSAYPDGSTDKPADIRPEKCFFQSCLCLCEGPGCDTNNKKKIVDCRVLKGVDYVISNKGTDEYFPRDPYNQPSISPKYHFVGKQVVINDEYAELQTPNSLFYYFVINGYKTYWDEVNRKSYDFKWNAKELYVEKFRVLVDGKPETHIFISLLDFPDTVARKDYLSKKYGKLPAREYEGLVKNSISAEDRIFYFERLRKFYPDYQLDYDVLDKIFNDYEEKFITTGPRDRAFGPKHSIIFPLYQDARKLCFGDCNRLLLKKADYRAAVYTYDYAEYMYEFYLDEESRDTHRLEAKSLFDSFMNEYNDPSYEDPLNPRPDFSIEAGALLYPRLKVQEYLDILNQQP